MHTEGHDMGRDAVGNTQPASQAPKLDPEHPGYEISDVNVSGFAVFLGGLLGTLVVFFFVCYGMGKVINNLWIKEDGPTTKWAIAVGAEAPGKGANLTSNAEIEQQQLQHISANFPEPRLDIDDGLQATADLHAKEDLLLEHYSTVDGQPGTIRIPIERAMELIAQNPAQYGLTAQPPQAAAETLAHAAPPPVQAPLTTGFARTGFELETIEAREQRMSYNQNAEK